MNKLSTIYKELEKVTNNTESSTIKHILSYYDDFLETGQEVFIETSEFDFFGEIQYLECTYTLSEILRQHIDKSYQYANDFINKDSPCSLELLQSFYPLVVSSIVSYLDSISGFTSSIEIKYDVKKDSPPFMENTMALLCLFALAYYDEFEQKYMFLSFHYWLNDKRFGNPEKSDSAKTLFPLVYHLARDKITNNSLLAEIDEGITRFKFNDTYQDFYDNYLSSDKVTTTTIFNNAINYHLKKSLWSETDLPEFDYPLFQSVPIEIITLLKMRLDANLDISFITHPILSQFKDSAFLNVKETFLNKKDNKLREKIIYKANTKC